MNTSQVLPADRVARELSHVRRKKLARIKKKIKSGKYEVSNWELAKALFLSQ